jgi:predicted RNA-binding protein
MKTLGIIDKEKMWADNSAMSMMKLCPRKYFLRIEQQITPAETSAALSTGGACHLSKATYLRAKQAGHPHIDCKAVAQLALSKAMLAIPNPDDLRNETVILRVMDGYFERWKDEPYKIGEIEIGFAVDLDNFIFIGLIDATKTLDAYGLLIEETKTTTVIGERWHLRTKPNSQIDGYVSGWYINTGEMPYGAILDVIPIYDETKTKEKTEAAMRKKIDKNKPFRFLTVRSEQDVDNWITNTKEWFSHLCRFKDSGIWPLNTDACAPLVGFTCEYLPVCSKYPSVLDIRSMEVSSIYKREEWEPWEISRLKQEDKK